MSSPRASRLRTLTARLRGLVRRTESDAEFRDEMQEHLELLTDRFVSQGLSREQAVVAARRRFGNTALLQEDRRSLQTLPAVEAWWHDLRYAVRTLWRSPGFTAVAIATLGLGIGAATAIFSVVHNVLLAPFPYPDADRLVFPRIHDVRQDAESGRQGYSAAEAAALAETSRVFEGTTAALSQPVSFRRGDGTEYLSGARVTPGTFEFFGLPALYGRVMHAGDYEAGAPPVFVLRHKTWMERFGGDVSVLNKTFLLNGTPRTLVGIMPPRFGWYAADVFFPEKLTRETTGQPFWFVVGRLKPGISVEQAEAELTGIAHRLAKVYPDRYPQQFTVDVRRLIDSAVGGLAPTLYTVLAAVGLLLLIACSNVANLMLARATGRKHEFALRTALGAGRTRIVRLLIVESLVLAMAGAALGVFLAWGLLHGLVAALPQDAIPAESVIQLNAPVLTVALCIAASTALIFGLLPALQFSRRELNGPIQQGGRRVAGGVRAGRLREAVVLVEVALSLALLVGAGLLMRSFVALRDVHLGLRPDHVFQVAALLPAERYGTAAQVAGFTRPLLARLKGLPGVEHAAASSAMQPGSGADRRILVAGAVQDGEWRALVQQVSEEIFQVLRVEVTRGRRFTEADVTDARPVAVVNETFVRRYLPGADPIGRRVRLASLEVAADSVRDSWFEIVGVVADVPNRGPHLPADPDVWIPSTVAVSAVQVLLVRTSQDPRTIANAVQRAVFAADPAVPLAFPSALEDWISERIYAGPRFGVLLTTVFGCVGLLLVTTGVYSVMAYSTAQKTHEIGIRMALGAKASDVLRMVVSTGLRPVTAGILIGIALSLLGGRLITSQLFGVTAADPPTLAAAAALLAMTGTAACWIPARRAARIDPIVALHHQ